MVDARHYAILEYLLDKPDGVRPSDLPENIKSSFGLNTLEEGGIYYEIQIVLQHHYKWVIPHRDKTKYYIITDLGITALMDYLQIQQKQAEREKSLGEKEYLELQQLRTNVQLLTNQLVDYERTKSNLKYSMIFNFILAIAAIAELILLLKGKE